MTTDELTRLLRGLQSLGIDMEEYSDFLFREPAVEEDETSRIIGNLFYMAI